MIHLIQHPDGLKRCSWCGEGQALADYQRYHDTEWGMPHADPKRLFEKITLEGFQSGLSWLTVLRKRDRFREMFAGFDFERVARFGQKEIDRLLGDAGIIRHRGKIESTINNARQICKLHEAGGNIAQLVWQYEPSAKDRPTRITPEVAMTLSATAESNALSKDLKKRGFSFVGPTTMYAFMQSIGMVNDHLEGCAHRASVEQARHAFVRPGLQ